MGVIFWYFYFRGRGSSDPREERKLQQIESELKDGKLVPAEFELRVNHPVQWLIHRYDSEPEDEIFEINELELYELLPAGHTTVMAFLPEKKGKFKIVLGTDRDVGVMKIE
ncbi:MAG: cupredoxin domain-containing protein [Calditrichaeota bacterium]|nr:cupredoxin domain-containing protein [Calditrichota bacterium]MCB9391758.1 cupredoxin domain-containing protein [Calditrichota bacterium]